MERWRGRVALVTGAAAGIGRATAVRLLSCGLNLVACDLRPDALATIRDEALQSDADVGELMTVKCDVSKEEEIVAMFERIKASKFAGVDICVNNAGVANGMLEETIMNSTTSNWRRILDVNVLGLAICTREALRSMRERGVDDGHIVNMASMAAHVVYPMCVMYSASKHAVRALTEGLRQELLAEKSGIRVTAISPGLVKTDIFDYSTEETKAVIRENYPQMLPADVASAIEFAVSAPKHVQVDEFQVWAISKPEGE